MDSPLRATRTNPIRTLRWRLLLVPLLLCLFPLVAVVAGNAWDKNLDQRILLEVKKGAAHLARGTDHRGGSAYEKWSLNLAQQNDWRVVLIDEASNDVVFDWDKDAGSALMQKFSGLILGGEQSPPSRRPLVTRGPYPSASCEVVTPPGILICRAYHHGPRGTIVVEQSSRRAVRALYDVRYPLFKLALFLVPFALFFAFWLDHRLLKPTLKLRSDIENALQKNTSPAFESSRDDEVGQLTRSLAELSARLIAQKKDTESLLGDLAHELKNPWSAVVSTLDTLQSRTLGEENHRLLSIIERSAESQLHTVDEFLSYARARADVEEKISERFCLRELLENVATFSPDANIEIECDAKLHVVWPAQPLSRILRNLIDNAQAFAKARVTIVAYENEGQSSISVTDDGDGVDNAFEKKLFTRFQSRKTGGTGLGLALSRTLAENLGGQLTYSRDELTRFTLSLPQELT